MTPGLETWLAEARADARRRGLPALEPLLDALAAAMGAVRAADWMERPDAAPTAGVPPRPPEERDE